MAKVDTRKFGPQYPGIPIGIVDTDSTVMVVRQFVDTQVRGRTTRLLEFRQIPGHFLYLSEQEVAQLVATVSDDDDLWIGAAVPLVKELVPSKRKGTDVQVWKLARPAEWGEIMAAYEQAQKKGTAARPGRAARGK